MGVSRLPQNLAGYSNVSLHEGLHDCVFPEECLEFLEKVPKQKVNWAERNSENREFWNFPSKAP